MDAVRGGMLGGAPFLLALGLMAGVAAWLWRRPDIHPDLLFQDVIDFNTTGRPYLGFFSNLGAMLWFSSASICGLAALLRWQMRASEPRLTLFLGALAASEAWLGFDDLFLFHESLAVRYLGLKEEWVLLLYALGAAVFLAAFFRELLRLERLYLCLALILLGISQDLDVANTHQPLLTGDRALILIEDIAQFLGSAALWTYCARVSLAAVLAAFEQRPQPAPAANAAAERERAVSDG